jgi:hypothetical protein
MKTIEPRSTSDESAMGLRALERAIAVSEIVVRGAEDTLVSWPPARDCADVEALILGWIASHAPAARSRGRVH